MVQFSKPCMITGKAITLTIWTGVGRVKSLLFNTLSSFVIAFLPGNNHLLISWLPSLSTFWSPRRGHLSLLPPFDPLIWYEVMGPDAMILVFLMFCLKLALLLSSLTLIKTVFSVSLPSAIRVVSSTFLRLLLFLPPALI